MGWWLFEQAGQAGPGVGEVVTVGQRGRQNRKVCRVGWVVTVKQGGG